MKILFLTNNPISENLIEWLELMNETVIVHKSKLTESIVNTYKPEFIISYNYRYIISQNIISLMNNKIINLHISFLPWNRGAHPNIWSFIENSPKGVTIHFIDSGIDTGSILVQKQFYFDENKETLQSTYNYLHTSIQSLFKSNWDAIKRGALPSKKQLKKGTYHATSDFQKVSSALGKEEWNIVISKFKEMYKKLG
jgi:methionyl-tRNA formyltransferase